MNLLERIKVSFDQLLAAGANHSYSTEVVKRFWGDKDQLSLQEILEKKVHPHLITWALLQEFVLPASVLHRIALQLAYKFVAEQRMDWASDADGFIDSLLKAKEDWLNHLINDSDLDECRKKADEIYMMYTTLGNAKATSIAAVIKSLLSTNAKACLWKVYYGTIESAKLTRELVSNATVSEAWQERLALIKNCLNAMAGNETSNCTIFSANEVKQFLELHAQDPNVEQMPYLRQGSNEPEDKQENELPIGSIIAYAAETYRGEEPAGWLLCDGRVLDRSTYADLFAAIETSWGSSGVSNFNIPDLRGLFLRATGGSNSINPDRGTRISVAIGGNESDKVGSYQDYATHIPASAFTGTIANAKVSQTNYDCGCQDSVALYDGNSTKVDITKGGGNETRPKNKAVHYLIKYARVVDESRVIIPLAAVFPFASKSGEADNSYWNLCDGTVLSNAGVNKELFNVMGFVHGGINEDEFLLPDYRDMFLRGVSGSDGRDPDVGMRMPPYKEGKYPGNKTSVGSYQNDDTARPKKSFSVKVTVPSGKENKIINGVIRNLYQYTDASTDVNLSQSGGDIETSPVNIRVNWLILRDKVAVDKFPIGAVIAFGGNKVSSEVWKLCDGSSLDKDKYPALFTVLKGDSQESTFNLPDYRGLFLRGANADKPVGTLQTSSTTKRPDNPFVGSIFHLPDSSQGVSGECYGSGASKDGSADMSAYEGGDEESRPRNCAVDYYIRVLESL